MVENDFYDLKISQKIWWGNGEYQIDFLRKVHSEKYLIGFVQRKEESFYWQDICSDCSLTPPVQKKKYHLYWMKSLTLGHYFKTDKPVDESGRDTMGTFVYIDWDKLEKIKCEEKGDWLEV